MHTALPLLAAFLALPALAQTGMEQMPAALSNVQFEDDNGPFVPNTFIGSFRMEMHNFKDGQEQPESPVDMHFWSSTDKTLTSFRTDKANGTEMKMMNDLKGKWSYIMMGTPNGQKTAMRSHKKKLVHTGEGGDAAKGINFTETKETKTIDGHACTKVIGRSKDGVWTAWVAKDMPTPFGDLVRNMGQVRQAGAMQQWSGLKGFPLEMEMQDLGGNDKTVIYVKDIKEGPVDERLFSLDGYKMMDVPGIGQ